MSETTTEVTPPKRVIVVLRRPEQGGGRNRLFISMGAAVIALILGAGLGFQGATLLGPRFTPAPAQSGPATLTKRVHGGIYALELAKPLGQSRWMLEFDAEITTRDGPNNAAELRNALERLVIEATSLPLVQTAPEPAEAARLAILAMATQDYPWLVDIYMTRSDVRAPNRRLEGMGDAMRNIE